jgi:hypothetical protein
MALKDKKLVPNMVGMYANAKKALIMKDMGNGHMRPYMWGMSVTVASGGTEALIASGTMGGVYADECVYSPCPVNNVTQCYISKDGTEHTVKVTFTSAPAADAATLVDVLVFMSTAADVDINDYTGNRGYQTGSY